MIEVMVIFHLMWYFTPFQDKKEVNENEEIVTNVAVPSCEMKKNKRDEVISPAAADRLVLWLWFVVKTLGHTLDSFVYIFCSFLSIKKKQLHGGQKKRKFCCKLIPAGFFVSLM